MDEAERCTRVGLMYSGKLIADDTPSNVKKMVTGELLEIAPSDFVSARELVSMLPCVKELQTYGDKLHVFVDDAARFESRKSRLRWPRKWNSTRRDSQNRSPDGGSLHQFDSPAG